MIQTSLRLTEYSTDSDSCPARRSLYLRKTVSPGPGYWPPSARRSHESESYCPAVNLRPGDELETMIVTVHGHGDRHGPGQ